MRLQVVRALVSTGYNTLSKLSSRTLCCWECRISICCGEGRRHQCCRSERSLHHSVASKVHPAPRAFAQYNTTDHTKKTAKKTAAYTQGRPSGAALTALPAAGGESRHLKNKRQRHVRLSLEEPVPPVLRGSENIPQPREPEASHCVQRVRGSCWGEAPPLRSLPPLLLRLLTPPRGFLDMAAQPASRRPIRKDPPSPSTPPSLPASRAEHCVGRPPSRDQSPLERGAVPVVPAHK